MIKVIVISAVVIFLGIGAMVVCCAIGGAKLEKLRELDQGEVKHYE